MTGREKMLVHHAYGIVEGIEMYGIPEEMTEAAYIADASERHGEFDIRLGTEGPEHWTRVAPGQFNDDEAALIRAMVAALLADKRPYVDRPTALLRKAERSVRVLA